MASDVTEGDGRYRGFDIDTEDEENPEETDLIHKRNDQENVEEPPLHSACTTTTCTTTATEYPKTAEALQRNMDDQASKTEKIQERLERYTEDTEDNESQSKKRKRIDSLIDSPNNGKEINAVTNADSAYKEVIRALTEENALLKEKLTLITQKLAEATDLKHKDKSDKSTEPKTPRTLSPPLPNIATLFQEMQTTMTNEISKMNESIKEVKESIEDKSSDSTTPQTLPASLINEFKDVMGALIDEKLEKKLEKIEQHTTQAKKSFAEAISGGNLNLNTIQVAMQDAKNNERVIETERVKREKNIILHGITEFDGTPEEIKEQEHDYVKSLLDIIGVKSKPEYIGRLGKKLNDRTRPIKLAMKTSQEKDVIMSRLVNLKNAEDKYRKISIKDDYTLQERLLVKQYLKEADEKNKAGNTDKWKVCGNPKNGLRVVEITKTTPKNQVATQITGILPP